MEEEWNGFAIIGTALCGIVYCYYVASRLPKGAFRVSGVAPVVGMFLYLPWKSSSIHIRGMMCFLFIWISSFKLLMLCYDVGPLASPWARMSLFRFLAMAAFPIKLRQSEVSKLTGEADSLKPRLRFSIPKMMIEFLLMILVVVVISSRDRLLVPKVMVPVLLGLHIYLFMDSFMVSLATMVDKFLAADLEPQFKKPYLSTSLQDFWGSRWNLIVTNIMRPSVYEPVLYLCWGIHRKLVLQQQKGSSRILFILEKVDPDLQKMKYDKPPVWARSAGVLATFVVSGLMHELILYYITESKVTWDIMAFFVLHGLCTVFEVGLRRASLSPEMILPHPVCVLLTVVFIYVTAFWLFFPKFLESGVHTRGVAEYEYVANHMVKALGSWAWSVPKQNETMFL